MKLLMKRLRMGWWSVLVLSLAAWVEWIAEKND